MVLIFANARNGEVPSPRLIGYSEVHILWGGGLPAVTYLTTGPKNNLETLSIAPRLMFQSLLCSFIFIGQVKDQICLIIFHRLLCGINQSESDENSL